MRAIRWVADSGLADAVSWQQACVVPKGRVADRQFNTHCRGAAGDDQILYGCSALSLVSSSAS